MLGNKRSEGGLSSRLAMLLQYTRGLIPPDYSVERCAHMQQRQRVAPPAMHDSSPAVPVREKYCHRIRPNQRSSHPSSLASSLPGQHGGNAVHKLEKHAQNIASRACHALTSP